MGRARRAVKKEKINKIKVIFILVCIFIIGITFYMIHDIQNKIDLNDNSMSIEDRNEDENSENIEIEKTEDTEEVIIENTVPFEELSEEEKKEIDQKLSSKENTVINESTLPAKPAITDKKQKAIELVKKKWGDDDTINVVFDHVNENEEYIVAVRDKSTATVKYYFKVNLDKETVEVDY